jgi:hypothetical protein
MPSYLLLLHQAPMRLGNLSPEEIQKIIGKYEAWRTEISKRNQLRGGEKLTDEGGRELRVRNEKVSVTDGPFSELQEVLGGFFMIEAANYDEAVEIARTCPHLSFGDGRIEVRQVENLHRK